MIEYIKTIWKNFWTNWNNLITVPIALVIWFASPPLIRLLDPTAGVFDAGVLQKFLFALVGILVADFVGWVLILLSWPTIHQTTKTFSQDFAQTTPKVRITCVIVLFALHFLGFVLLVRAI